MNVVTVKNGGIFLIYKIISVSFFPMFSFQSGDLSQGPYESIWWSKDVKYRKDLFLLVAQFNKIVVFSAGPFTKLTVATFISVSCFESFSFCKPITTS